ncbi:MAG: type II toxin-antitoxin system Phd/YefM family antitoxin [Enterococcus sp.]
MELKKIEVPTSSITEVKKSPMDVFNQAREAQTGVYVFNREKIAGVMLTQEQYETLVQELADLRAAVQAAPQPIEEVENTEEAPMITATPTFERQSFVEPVGLEDLTEELEQELVRSFPFSAKDLDEQMVTSGFITRKTGFGGVVDILNELASTGKIKYQLRKKHQGTTVIAEVYGRPDEQVNDHLYVTQVHLILE